MHRQLRRNIGSELFYSQLRSIICLIDEIYSESFESPNAMELIQLFITAIIINRTYNQCEKQTYKFLSALIDKRL